MSDLDAKQTNTIFIYMSETTNSMDGANESLNKQGESDTKLQ